MNPLNYSMGIIMKRYGFSKSRMAEKLGLSRPTLNGWLCKNPVPEVCLRKFADAMGLSYGDLTSEIRQELEQARSAGRSFKPLMVTKTVAYNIEGANE